jgi:hypothetical protein
MGMQTSARVFPTMFSLTEQFHSISLKSRESRLKTAKRESARSIRQLERDRVELERQERRLVKKNNLDAAIEASD